MIFWFDLSSYKTVMQILNFLCRKLAVKGASGIWQIYRFCHIDVDSSIRH
jgi:hypothetical protein